VKRSAERVADVPPGVVTVTSTVPAAPAGEVAVIFVADRTVTDVAAVAPNLTVAPATNALPVIVTDVPPFRGPEDGLTPVTAGTESYAKRSEDPVRDVPPGVMTVTSTVPAAWGGEVAVIEVDELTVNDAAALAPNLTAVAPLRLLPLTVTVVPPATGPAAGLTPLTAGAAV
jgi:hypothetical protein